jgi:hypothetical protein
MNKTNKMSQTNQIDQITRQIGLGLAQEIHRAGWLWAAA